MLALLVAAAAPAYSPGLAGLPLPPLAATRGAAVTMAADDGELAMLQAMSDSFWKQKRARMKAELAAQLLELDEFEAREKALQEVAMQAGAGAAGAPSLEVAELQAQLEAEKAKSAALQAELQKTVLEAEVNVQKVASFWISKLNEAKGALPAAAADAAPAAAAAAPAAAGPDLVENVPKPFLEEDLSLRELRSRLLGLGLSTIGVKSELRARLMYALEHSRTQYQTWDSVAKVWK